MTAGQFYSVVRLYGACPASLIWIDDREDDDGPAENLWRDCPNSEWMLWLLGLVSPPLFARACTDSTEEEDPARANELRRLVSWAEVERAMHYVMPATLRRFGVVVAQEAAP